MRLFITLQQSRRGGDPFYIIDISMKLSKKSLQLHRTQFILQVQFLFNEWNMCMFIS